MATQTESRTQDLAPKDLEPTAPGNVEPVSIENGTTSTNGGNGSEGGVVNNDPFKAMRSETNDPFASQRTGGDTLGELGSPPQNRRMSKEWDASKVPPSRFQKREGSIYATPGSRDGHVGRNKQTAYKDKLKEKGWFK